MNFENKADNPLNPGVVDISPHDVLTNLADVVLVDVRGSDEYTGELGHIAGSSLITLDTLQENLDSIPKDKTVVFICRSGARSGRATALALENGFTEVYNMRGGMMLWNQNQYDVER